MSYDSRGVKFVLTAPDTESTEQEFSPWKQMVYASAPARYVPRFLYKNKFEQPKYPDGTAMVMPYGVRVIEAILLRHYPADDVAVCHPDDLDHFVGPNTVAVGVGAHNPIGTAFSTGVYSNIFGSSARPVNAAESERIYLHPALRKYRPKVIVGGAGAWQIPKTDSMERLGVDCIINGRAEGVALELFRKAEAGEELPRIVNAVEPTIDQLVIPSKRSTYGIVEMNRGCGRQCAFCSPTLETRISVPPEQAMEAVRANTRNGGKIIFPVSEDVFIYGAAAPFYIPNPNAIMNFYDMIAREPGVEYLPLSHATIAPAVVNPDLVREMSKILLDKSALRNRNSTHPDKKFLAPLIGIETGSSRLAALTMSGKSLPFDIRDWQEIVVEGIRILNENNWFPVCTFIIGLPNETEEDLQETLQLLHRLKKAKVLYVPSIFTPLEDTRMSDGAGLKAKQLTQVQWEFMMTAWMQSRDFGEMRDRSRGYFKWGTKAFYYGRGRWVHGKQFKWPAMRFAGMPEETVSQHLFLNWDKENTTPIEQPRLIGKHRKQSLEQLRTINDDQPFSIYGTSRVEDDEKPAPVPAVSKATAAAPNGRSNGAAKLAEVDQPVAGD
ncbi:MAG: radical SAM protein [Acidobacteria bacterium]|nr:radical SAM protein [Acidobacteriota bacterium]